MLLLPLLLLTLSLVFRKATRAMGVLLVVTVAVTYVTYAVSGPTMDYLDRFADHAIPVLCLGAGIAAGTLAPRVVGALLGVVAVGWSAVAGATAPDLGVIANYGPDLQRAHVAIGKGLAEADVPAPARSLAVTDAGAIPYYSGWQSIDYIGLNDPKISRGADPTQVVMQARPTVIVVTANGPEPGRQAVRLRLRRGDRGLPGGRDGRDARRVLAGRLRAAAVRVDDRRARPGARRRRPAGQRPGPGRGHRRPLAGPAPLAAAFLRVDRSARGRNGGPMSSDEVRHGVKLSSLDQEVFPDAGVTKRELLDYLEAVADRMLPELRDRPLTVLRVLRGQGPFMQKNLPKYTPDWVERVSMWAETRPSGTSRTRCATTSARWCGSATSARSSSTRRSTAATPENGPTHLILDLDPPEDGPFSLAIDAAKLVREALRNDGLDGAVKTSGSKGAPRLRAAGAGPVDGGHRGGDPGAHGPRRTHRPFAGDDGVRQGTPRGQGVPGFDPRGRRDGGVGLQPAPPPGHAGVVPGPLGRPRRRQAG